MIQVFENLELSHAAAELFVTRASEAIPNRGLFHVVLAGGDTPRRTYEMLACTPFRNQVDWTQVHVWWGDERCVAPHDARSNYGMACEALLDHVAVPSTQMHRIHGELSPEAAASDYQLKLERFFQGCMPRFDLVLLGLGEDGHTASLFPGSTALAEQRRWVAGIESTSLEVSRVSLTAPVLNESAAIVFLVAGSTKAPVLAQVLEGPLDPCRLPAQLIRPRNGELCWMLDRKAASMLKSTKASSNLEQR
jgi:6-phosphogluconolactonase